MTDYKNSRHYVVIGEVVIDIDVVVAIVYNGTEYGVYDIYESYFKIPKKSMTDEVDKMLKENGFIKLSKSYFRKSNILCIYKGEPNMRVNFEINKLKAKSHGIDFNADASEFKKMLEQ